MYIYIYIYMLLMLERIPRACPTEKTFLRKKIEVWTRFDLIVGRRRDISIRSVETFPRALKVATIPLETLDSEHRLVHRAGIHADKPGCTFFFYGGRAP